MSDQDREGMLPVLRNFDRLTQDSPIPLVVCCQDKAGAETLAKSIPDRLHLLGGQGIGLADAAVPARHKVGIHAPGDDTECSRLLAQGEPEGHRLAFLPQAKPGMVAASKDFNTLALEYASKGGCTHLQPVCVAGDKLAVAEPIEVPAPPDDEADLAAWQQSQLRRLLEEAELAACDLNETLAWMMVRQSQALGTDRPVFRQVVPTEVKLDFRLLLRGAFALGADFAGRHRPGERVGLMLPTSAGTAAVFYACQVAGVVPALLNITAGGANLVSAAQTAGLQTVYTAQALLDKVDTAAMGADALRKAGVTIHLLEDIRQNLSLGAKLGAVLGMAFPRFRLRQLPGGHRKPDDEAVILFTSGSEGHPKGVVLSNRNIVANAGQILRRIEITDVDLILNSLPVFHSFGMIGGLVLPVAGGIRTLQYPSPLDFKKIPELVKSEQATIIFSTNTFLAKYAANSSPGDFDSLRLIIAGGEKLRDNVVELWQDSYHKQVSEGYGVTETAPGIAINVPNAHRHGSVGLPLPGMEVRLEPQEGIDNGGRLLVRGPNVMLGYLLSDRPGELVPPPDGWHDSGDICEISPDGYLKIVGRHRRFAKIAGEMVPLIRLEEVLGTRLGEEDLGAVVAVADDTRGEKLVYVTNREGITIEALGGAVRAAGLPDLWVPREVITVADFPLMPTGKTDYPALDKLVAGKMAAAD